MPDLTRLLDRVRNGDHAASEQLARLLYGELRSMAQRQLAGERRDHTLQPTALVHEAWLRLAPEGGSEFENHAHFLGAGALAIRRVLVEHARKRGRIKRGGGLERVDLDAIDPAEPVRDESLLALDEALDDLAAFAPLHARVVELRFFAGMTVAEVAKVTNVSESTVQREWRIARAWLRERLEERDGP